MATGGDARDIDLGSYRSFDDIGAGDAKIYQDLTESSAPRRKTKQPRRVIHFVDGSTMDEFSSDEEDEAAAPPPAAPVDVKKLNWPQWLWHYTIVSATKSLAVADFCGEKLAWFFGITTPKYQYVIDEYNRMKDEEERRLRLEKEARVNELCEQTSALDHVEEGAVAADAAAAADEAEIELQPTNLGPPASALPPAAV